jgi:hypothetical protein
VFYQRKENKMAYTQEELDEFAGLGKPENRLTEPKDQQPLWRSDLLDVRKVDAMLRYEQPVKVDTSAEARKSIQPHLSKMKQRVLLSLHLDGDATDDELEQRLNMSHQSLSACRRGCVKDELVAPTGKTRPTRSGRKANVWTVTNKYDPRTVV